MNRRTNRSSTSRTHMAPAEKSFAGSSVPGSDTTLYRRVSRPYGLPASPDRASGLAVRASNERDLGTLSAGSSCLRTPFRKTTDATRDGRTSLEARSVATRAAVSNHGSGRCLAFDPSRPSKPSGQGPLMGEKTKKVANALSTWNRARSPAELKHIIERRKGNQKGFPQ